MVDDQRLVDVPGSMEHRDAEDIGARILAGKGQEGLMAREGSAGLHAQILDLHILAQP